MVNYNDIFEEALYLFENDPDLKDDKTAVARFLKHKYNMSQTLNSVRLAIGRKINKHYADNEIIAQNVIYKKQKQKAQDKNRIANKSFREFARMENALQEFAKSQLEIYKEHGESLKNIKLKPIKKNKDLSGVGVMQISDLHGNELVDLPHNKYDFNILSKRLKLYANQCLEDFTLKKYKKVALLFTGDLLNSDRRLDELLSASTNRAKATSLMRYILLQLILDIRNAGFEITIVSVLGNESRVGKEMPFSNQGLSDNYDFMIINGIKQILEFSEIKGINFGSIDKVEEIVTIDGRQWLLAHDVSKMTSQQKSAQSGIGRQSLNGNNISFIIGGHIHATNIGDFYARSGSTVGANSYSENALGLFGYASQNYYLCRNGRINKIAVDLQNIEGVEGYDILDKLAAYNAKSVSKLENKTTVLRVVI